MKKILLGISLVLMAIVAKSQGLEDIIVEKYYIANAEDAAASTGAGDTNPLKAGAVTYRIYADMLPGYRVTAVYWDQNHSLVVKSTTSFYNSTAGGSIPSFGRTTIDDETNNLDSWVTMGAGTSVGTTQANWGIPKADDNAANLINFSVLNNTDASMGLPLSQVDGLYMTGGTGYPTLGLIAPVAAFANAGNLETLLGDPAVAGNIFDQGGHGDPFSAGSWYNAGSVGGGNPATFPKGTDNKLLIAQFTTDGVFEFKLNIQITSNANNSSVYYVWNKLNDGNNVVTEKNGALVYPRVEIAPTVNFISSNFDYKQPVSASSPIKVEAIDPDDNQIDSVVFYVNNKKIGTDVTLPYEMNWTTPAGSSFVGQDTASVIKVVAFDKDTLRTYKIDTIVTDKTITLIKNIGSDIACRIYPNPAKNIITVEANDASDGSIIIYNIFGVIVEKRLTEKSSGTLTETFDITSLPKGHYIVEYNTCNAKITKRIVKL